MEDTKSTSEEGKEFTITQGKAFIMHVDNTDWKSCDNCSKFGMLVVCGKMKNCLTWLKIPCPFCGGPLSEIREHKGKKYRHCYACHFEFEEEKE